MKRKIIDKKNKRSQLRHDRHSVSLVAVHLVFCTKYRRPVLIGEIATRCEEIFRSIAKDIDVDIKQLAVNPEHVHMFIKYPPKHACSYIALRFKGASSYLLRKEFPELKELHKTSLWAPSCYHGSVGQGFEVVENYIKAQEEHHKLGKEL